LLDWLAEDFRSHHYDIRRLVRSIVLSRGYQLAPPAVGARPAPDAFAAALERPLPAETLARSMERASGRTPLEPALRQALIEAFPEILPRVTRATIQQAMLLANNEKLAALFRPDTNAPANPPKIGPSVEQSVRDVFQRVLVRAPEADELARSVEFLKAHRDQPDVALGQLHWALVAGPEFLINR